MQRGPNSKLWQREFFLTNSEGDVTTNTQSYTELGTGISYIPDGGTNYVDTVEEVDAVPGGAQAVQGPHKVQWAVNGNTPGTGAVTITTTDSKQLSCSVFGLAYFDLSSGSNAAIATLQDCTGSIAAPNQVIYGGAFSNLNASICYTYTKAGVSQDIVLKQAPPAPDADGLSDSSSVLQVYTEWFNSPDPVASSVTNGNVVDEEVLSFGAMSMGVGHVLFVDGQQSPVSTGTVKKQWVNVNNRIFLIESIGWPAISNQVQLLPQASNLNPRRGSIRGLALLDSAPKVSAGILGSANVPLAPVGVPPMKVVKADRTGRRLSIDYDLLSGSQYVTLQGDSTYLVSSLVNVTNVLTIEGGSVVKYSPGGEIAVSASGSNIVCETSPYRPGVFTSVYDSTVGGAISNGTPSVSCTYLSFTLPGTQPLTLRYLRFSYASTAIAGTVNYTSGASDWIKLWDCQFYDCGTGFLGEDNNEPLTLYAYNVLFSDMSYGVLNNVSNSYLWVNAANVTADAMNYFTWDVYGNNVSAANSLFTAVTNNQPWRPLTTNCSIYSTSSGIYDSVGAAGYYLASGSTNRAAGTAGIEAGLLADLQTLTTYPPTVIPNNVYITTSTILSQQAGRYSGIPDIGYCYSPIDWAIDSAVTNAGVTVSPGTVLAGYGAYGIVLWGTASLTFNGTANSPCYFVKYNTVQEQSNVSWEESQSSWDGCLEIAGTGSVTSEFTDWSVLAGDSLIAHYQNLASLMAAQNCQFYNGVVSLTGQTLVSSNCLYQRVATSVTEAGIESEDNTFANNLLWNGSLTVKHNGTGTWTFRDNLFDQTLIWTNSPGKYIDICSNNAYMMNSGVTTLTNLLPANHDVTLTASPSYQTGILGQFYYPSTEASLIFRGSQSATNAGLYYYTVTTNNQIDGTSNVSIGFHYATPPAPVITSQPESVVTTVNGSATFSVTAWGAPPLSYQWYSNGVALSGYTNSTLTLSGVPAWAAGAYQVEVTDPLGTTMSGVVTLKVAQNDFYVNYWNPNAVSPINTMLGGMTGADFFTPAERFPIIQATTNSSMRGVEAGTFAQGYNWMRLTSQQIDVNYTNGYGANSVTPVTTLDMLKDASTNGTSLVFTVNCLGDGYIIPNYTYGTNSYTNVFSVTNSSITFLSTLASNWVRYANFLVQNYCWSNAVVVPYGANPTSLGYSDGVLITNIHNNWVAIANGQTTYLPTLQTYPNLATNLPKVMYWEIGNEVESPLPSQYYAITNTNMVLTNYVNLYTNIRAAMLGADSTIKIGPGFGNGFTNGTIATGANTIINPLFANTNVSMDFIVYHPYPADPTSDWMNGTNGNISGLVSDLEGIWDWQDVERNSMYGALAANQRQFNIPLLATEYSGDSAESASFSLQASMWTLLANTETVLAMAKGQQTLGAEYWIGADTYADWELLFTRFQSNLGNVFLSCSDGDGVVPQLWSAATTNTAAGSTQSPFRVYSTINTNSGNGTLSVWMLNLQNTSSQTVDLHLPGAASSGTLFTLGCPNAPPSLINQGAFTDITNIPFSGGTNFVWSNTSITIAGSNAIVMTNPPATVSVAQFWLASTPSSPVAPTITAVPVNGHPGQIITITGTQFSPNALQDIVYFGGVRGVVTSATSTTLNVQVPFGASYGPVTVTVSNLTAYSTNFFNPAYYGPGVSSPIVMSGSWVASINPLNPFFATTNLVIHGVGFFDADGDGKGDVAYLAPNVAAIVENGSTGPGNFDLWSGAPYSLPIGAQPSAMAAGDLDGDGLLDWVVLGYNLNNLQIFRNASAPQNISFAMGGTYLTGNSPWDVKIADIDGDGRPDIIVANYSDNTVSVLRNISTGQGNIAFAQATNFPACGTPYALAVGDIDGDGKPDIAVEGYVSSGSNVVVLRNTSTPGTISFTSPIAIIPTNLPYAESIALGDFNADGKLDIAVGANQLTFPGIFICINASTPGSISFNSAAYVAQVTDPRDIAIADYNGDGQLDFAAVDGSSDLLYTFQSKWTSGTFSSSSFTASSAYSAGSSSVADSIRLIAGDIDGDGRPDLIVGDFNGMDVVLFQNISQY